MFCPECGLDAEEARFCPDCGTNLELLRSVTGEVDVDDEAGGAPRPASRTTASRGRTTPQKSSSRPPKPRPPSGRPRAARSQPIRADKPRRVSPTVIWMGFAALAVVVIITAVAVTRTLSDSARASNAGQKTAPIAADTSGTYSVLVQRANGLYDQGAQAFQKKDQSSGVRYFAAAAKVYRAAWKQQATDPNVGTDYATSLFYSDDTDGALRQVNAVLAKSPDFQTAHLNKGVYLQTASRTAQDSGQKARADSLLAQAKAEFEKAVSIDPASSAGAKAAASLNDL
jgi:hypothetical protein